MNNASIFLNIIIILWKAIYLKTMIFISYYKPMEFI